MFFASEIFPLPRARFLQYGLHYVTQGAPSWCIKNISWKMYTLSGSESVYLSLVSVHKGIGFLSIYSASFFRPCQQFSFLCFFPWKHLVTVTCKNYHYAHNNVPCVCLSWYSSIEFYATKACLVFYWIL